MSDQSNVDKLKELEEEKSKVYARMKEVRELIQNTTSSDVRRQQSERLRILRDMYRNLVDQIEMIRPPDKKHRKTPTRQIVRTDAVGFDFFERCGSVWSDIEGHTWNEFSAVMANGSAHQANILMRMLAGAMQSLTEKQARYIILYYTQGKKMVDIAAEEGVGKSSVSRGIRQGMKRIESHIIAALKVQEHLSEQGFDFMAFADSTDVLTERQREMLYFLLTDKTTMTEVATYVDRTKSSVSRSWRRIGDNLSNVRSNITATPSARKIVKQDWVNIPEKEVAERLGISPAAYFRYICRDEKIGPYSRYMYEILRLRGHMTPQGAARFLGVNEATVRRHWKSHPEFNPDDLPVPEPYSPVRVKETSSNNIRRLLHGVAPTSGNTIGDQIDSETYRKLMEVPRACSQGK